MSEKPQAPSVVDERRQASRKKTLKGGQVIYSGHNCVMDCLVSDISEKGARLRPADPVNCPPAFTLKLSGGETFHCEVIWQKEDQVGVVFRS